eukprot:TRINITY_DN15838_c0_g2_i5.p1 TRINITY_DN15838_c0_g2~~TRINITY_DN15838_c0_g2_i5.p1  ORF type:complete len:525 (+),score=44.92 TRINITY_DN15838_c0_g2_i5:69-1577(+)
MSVASPLTLPGQLREEDADRSAVEASFEIGVAPRSDAEPEQSENIARVRASLDLVKKQGRKRQLRIRGPPFLVGNASLTAVVFVICRCGVREGWENVIWSLDFLVAQALWVCSFIVLFLCLLPSDKRWLPYAIIFTAFALFFASCATLTLGLAYIIAALSGECSMAGVGAPCSPCWYLVLWGTSMECCAALCTCACVICLWAVRRRASAPLYWDWLAHVQKWLGIVLIAIFLIFLPLIIGAWLGDLSHKVRRVITAEGAYSLFLGVVMLEGSMLGRARSWLLAQGEGVSAAAAVSELLAGRNTQTILATARQHFCCISADLLTREHMCDSSPNRELFKLAKPAELGGVDAFLSHSWQDNPGEKWEGLQAWREGFKKTYKREPTLWIDRYCIDQNNIEQSLAFLPVYLSGCKRLLILCGETYLKRLWCLMELLVFIEMGADYEHVEVCRLRSSMSTMDSIEEFDPKHARCSVVEDTRHLRAVINVTSSESIIELVKSTFFRHH